MRTHSNLVDRLKRARERLTQNPPSLTVEGRLTRMVGLALEATGCRLPVGGRAYVVTADGGKQEAEVVGFHGDNLYLMPKGDITGLEPGAPVIPIGRRPEISVGPGIMGRVVDGNGRPLDGLGPLHAETTFPLDGRRINPLQRKNIDTPLDVGVRAINALLTVGKGQRMGLFAGSGVGKSVLLGMMTRHTNADVIVVGLIGERGREVKEFIDHILGPEGMQRAVVVAVPADQSPLMRLQGAMTATSIAEYFRDQGLDVLLLMDSLTRFCQAQRELGLAIGEPPATKGYPPSVFAKLPKLVERAGNAESGRGSITAFYTVLTEGDDQQDPIADAARAILDGHIVLSRTLAEQGHYPAIDIEASVSRALPLIVPEEAIQMIHRFKRIYSTYVQNADLISVGAYNVGTDPAIDEAIQLRPTMTKFLTQSMREKVSLEQAWSELAALMRSENSSEDE